MNNSKKMLKGPQQVKKAEKKINPKLWIIPSIILGIFLIFAVLFDQLYERTIVTIDDDKYHLDDLTYYFYNVESYYDTFDQYYASFGMSYWDQAGSNGQTVREMAKSDAVSTAIYTEIMYREAVDAGYTLNEEETEQIEEDIASILYEQGLSSNQIKENGFTPEYLKENLGKAALARRYKEDIIGTLGVDTDAITAEFVKEDYRQYDFEYLFVSTETTDDSGNTVALDEAAKKTAYDKIQAQYDKAKETEDWSTLIPEEEKELKYNTTHILENTEKETNNADFSEEFRTWVKELDNDTVSEIFEDEKGYYLVRMLDNNSTESYDQAVEAAITQAEEEVFQEEYNQNILPKHEYKIHNSGLRRITMGSLTID